MKYRLKDKELQKKLDAISGGDFTVRLNQKLDLNCIATTVSFGEEVGLGAFPRRLVAVFHCDEIEEDPEYDPRKWNSFPEVTPPMEQDMRVETLEGRGYQAWWDGSKWLVGDHSYEEDMILSEVKRFRPWVGPDEEGEECEEK